MNHLKIVHINTSGVGGAAIACQRLHHLMQEAGIQSNIIYLYDNFKREKNLHTIGYKGARRFVNHVLYYVTQKDLTPEAYVFNEMAPVSSNIAKYPLVVEADVIYLHWVLGGFFSYKDLEEIAVLGKPVFCFTHDMWWITGGCHYSFECEQYRAGCEKCPKHKYFFSLTSRQANKKKRLYEKYPNIHFISPSDWLRKCTNQSYAVGNGRCSVIPNVVPDSIFKYIDKYEAKEMLELPHDKIIIAFGTADNTNKVKGCQYLLDALNMISDNRILLCVYGSDYDVNLVKQVNHPICFLGKLTDPFQVALANAAADLFVSPTLAESFGQTLLENIKCGTPVISTNITAVPEIVKDHINGYLVEPRNSTQIKDAILSFIEKPLRLDGVTDNMFNENTILNRHLELIQESLK